MSRFGYISDYDLGFLAGMDRASEVVAKYKELGSPLPVERVVYASAFQAGIDLFMVTPFRENYKHRYRFVQERLVRDGGHILICKLRIYLRRRKDVRRKNNSQNKM